MDLYRGCFVHTPALGVLEILEDHLLAVSPAGVISHLSPFGSPSATAFLSASGTAPDQPPAATDLTAAEGCFFLPTFVDAHIHAPQYLYAGTALDKPLMEWLEAYAFKAESAIDGDPEGLGREVYGTLARRLIGAGTGCVAAYGTVGVKANVVLAEELSKAGVRGFVGKVNMDRNSPASYRDPTASASISSTEYFLSEMSARSLPLVSPILTPRFVPTCTNELLAGLGKLAEERGLLVQTHACESLEEVDFTRRLSSGKGDLEVLGAAGLLGRRTLLAHCTHAPTPAAGDGGGYAVAHCPLSNAYFSTRPFALREHLDAGTRVGLGSDIAGGYRLDPMDGMRHAVVSSRNREGARREADSGPDSSRTPQRDGGAGQQKGLAVSWKEALYLATKGGGEALHVADRIGTFEVGKSFDAQFIQPGRGANSAVDYFDGGLPGKRCGWEERVERWWCCGDRMDIAAAWTQGLKRYSAAAAAS